VVVTILSGNFFALLLVDSITLLFSFVFSLLPWNLVALLFRSVLGNLLILCVAILPVFSGAFFLGSLVALLLGHTSCHSFLDILALANGHWTADRLTVGRTDLLSGVLSVGNRL